MDGRLPNLDNTLNDERVRQFLPLVYLAWSDGELSKDELEGICAEIAKHNGIDITRTQSDQGFRDRGGVTHPRTRNEKMAQSESRSSLLDADGFHRRSVHLVSQRNI